MSDLGTENAIKSCAYPTCTNTLPAESEYEFCEVCRVIVVRNALTLCNDPTSPISDRAPMAFHRAICNMRPEEILNLMTKLEWTYLETCKIVKSRQIQEYRRTSFQMAVEEVNGERSKPTAPKTAKRKESKKQKLIKTLGGNEELARDLMSEDFSDL